MCFHNQAVYKIVWPKGEVTPFCIKCKKRFIDPISTLIPAYIRICGIHEKIDVLSDLIEVKTVNQVTVTPSNPLIKEKVKAEEDLRDAIYKENYELAAELRDKIKNLEQRLEKENKKS